MATPEEVSLSSGIVLGALGIVLFKSTGLFSGQATWHGFVGGGLVGIGFALGSIAWTGLARADKLPAWSVITEPPKYLRFPFSSSPSLLKLWLRHRRGGEWPPPPDPYAPPHRWPDEAAFTNYLRQRRERRKQPRTSDE